MANHGEDVANATFIAAARQDVPALLAALTAAAERERVLREALVEYADDSNWARHPGRDDDARLYLVVGDGYDRARAALEATS